MTIPTTASFRGLPHSSIRTWKKIGLFLILVCAVVGLLAILVIGIFSSDDEDDYDGLDLPQKLAKSKPALINLELDHLEDLHFGDEIEELPDFVGMDQANSKLIGFIQSEYLIRPAPRYEPYRLRRSVQIDTPLGIWTRSFFKDKRGLVFVEAGASDGETFSNTLFLERELGWSGLLIECNPKATPDLVSANRKAWIATVCISNNTQAQKATMSIPVTKIYDTRLARLGPAWDYSYFGVDAEWTTKEGMDAVPLYSILAAVGLKNIDYFCMNIGGMEFDVLQNFPFDKIFVKVWMVNVFFYSEKEKTDLKTFMKKNGYKYVRMIDMNEVFVHKSLLNSDEVARLDEL